MKQITPMELLTLFHKSDFLDTNLTVYEHKLLSVILTFVNSDVSLGYKAWPSSETLTKRTGIKTTTLTTARKSLLREGFLLHIKPNAGPGRSCVYIVNPKKIIDLAEKAGSKATGKAGNQPYIPPAKPPHERNKTGLRNQKPAAQPKPVTEALEPDWFADNIDLPF